MNALFLLTWYERDTGKRRQLLATTPDTPYDRLAELVEGTVRRELRLPDDQKVAGTFVCLTPTHLWREI